MGNWYIMGVINWYMVSNLYDIYIYIYIIWYINHVYIYIYILYTYMDVSINGDTQQLDGL
jgi:hypothetical protein